ncbi:MAG: DeoD-type purine-nucleoside phosphorylase [SAR324 cluster bacterium]|nr:DeoD-type purine-nucleoside phosphorylase [SAR324 cluster bacterium]
MPIHVRAKKDQIAPYVLLPGDPERSEYIAHKFLENPKLYTSYRKMFGYTGTYKGMRVSVQTTGMGTPSASIVVEELFQLGAEVLCRVGTMGGLQPNMKLADLVLVQSAWSSREIVSQITESIDYMPCASWPLLKIASEIADKKSDLTYHVGSVASVNLFYNPDQDLAQKLSKLGCLGFEMEAAAIFALAAKHQKLASCLLTISDLIADSDNIVRASDQKILAGVDYMVSVALESFYQHDKLLKN